MAVKISELPTSEYLDGEELPDQPKFCQLLQIWSALRRQLIHYNVINILNLQVVTGRHVFYNKKPATCKHITHKSITPTFCGTWSGQP